MQWSCTIVVIWEVDVQSALRPDEGQSSCVDGVRIAVTFCKSAMVILLLLRGEIVRPLSLTQYLQILVITVAIPAYCMTNTTSTRRTSWGWYNNHSEGNWPRSDLCRYYDLHPYIRRCGLHSHQHRLYSRASVCLCHQKIWNYRPQ